MKDSLAIKPNFFNKLPTLVAEEQAQIKGVSEEEQHLYLLSSHSGWKILESFSQQLLKDLDNITELSLTQGLDLEEIGKNAVVANLSKGLINKILQKVSDAVEACEKSDGTIK